MPITIDTIIKVIDVIKEVIKQINKTETDGILKSIEGEMLSGYSGKKVIGLLQRLTKLFENQDDVCYVEVGVFKGLTLLSVAISCPGISCYGIDNFKYFNPDGQNLEIIKSNKKKLKINNISIIDSDYEDAFENMNTYIGNKKIAVYFIDGPHDYRSQLMCLQLVLPYLHQHAIIIIDDSNYRHVRLANRDFLLTHPEYKLICEAYTNSHPENMPTVENQKARNGWWNGINVIYKDVKNVIEPLFPPTERNRLLFENEHTIHADVLAEYAPQAMKILEALSNYNLKMLLITLWKTLMLLKKEKNKYKDRFLSMNTYSNNLSRFRCNNNLNKEN
jgi:precorrin-6B methylase 2